MAGWSPHHCFPRLCVSFLFIACWTPGGLCLKSRFPGHQATALARGQLFCERNLMLTLETCVQPYNDNTTYVVTGDIDAMWIRDSAAQLHPYIDLAKQEGHSSRLRPQLEGALRSQAQFILTDPYANAFTRTWDSARNERLARGGYVFTGNYELDDGPYFFRFIAHLARAFPDTKVVREDPVHLATKMLVALYRQEQQHARGASQYRYPKWEPWELSGRSGLGNPVRYTGMVWGAFRPSDDAQQYGYNIPGNIFLAASLGDVALLAEKVWRDARLAASARRLRAEIVAGVRRYGIGRGRMGEALYCYEVDGLGNCTLMDDANVPSLLSLPYLDPKAETFDMQTYRSTRRFILSSQNPWYFEGAAGRGVGSPHTGKDMIWPLALVMQAITAETKQESDEVVGQLMRPDVFSTGLVESFHKDDASRFTRKWFGWPNALFGEHLLSQGRCRPDLAQTRFPAPRPAPRGPARFYGGGAALLRRPGVTLPGAFFY